MNDKIFCKSVYEARAAYDPAWDAEKDRKAFVHNLGVLLSQTREGISGCELIKKNGVEYVMINYIDRSTPSEVCVNMDSYTAIVREISNFLL